MHEYCLFVEHRTGVNTGSTLMHIVASRSRGNTFKSLSERLVIPSVTFGQVTDAYKYYADEMFDGILGLPPSKLSNDGIKPVFRQAVDKKLVDKPMFTIWSRKPLPGDLGEQQPPGGNDQT